METTEEMVDEMGMDEMGMDEMVVDEKKRYALYSLWRTISS